MAIPNNSQIKEALLELLQVQNEIRLSDAYNILKEKFRLSDEEFNQKYPSGSDFIFKNRIRWAKQDLINEGVVVSSQIGYLQLRTPDQNISPKRGQKNKNDATTDPIENIEYSYRKLNESLKKELLTIIKNSSWQFFEQLVIDLLLKMGYGNSRVNAGQAFQTTNDEGIDGVINEDTLGLDKIYIQAKKWEKDVSRPDIQEFIGALAGRKSKKGVFITTSHFSTPAKEYVNRINEQIVLIDGDKLTSLMLEFGLGITTIITYDIYRIDRDYFEI